MKARRLIGAASPAPGRPKADETLSGGQLPYPPGGGLS